MSSIGENTYFPLFIDLKGRRVVVFGGGEVATRRINVLLSFGALVTVVANELSEELEKRWKKKEFIFEQRSYRVGEIKEAFFVLAATNHEAINLQISNECRHKEVWVNNASKGSCCDFYFPAVIRKEDMVIGITGNGKEHKKLKRFVDGIRHLLHQN